MNNLIEPNIHPILVHFTFALTISALAAYLLAAFAPSDRWRSTLRPAADWMLAFAALAIVLTIAAGFQAFFTVDHDEPAHIVMTKHRNWAVPTGTAVLLLSLWRWRTREKSASPIFIALLAAAAIALSVTAWLGGQLVYGHGIGVKSLPVVTGEGHNHEHGGHDHGAKTGDNDHDEDAMDADHDHGDDHGSGDKHEHGDADDHAAGEHDHGDIAAAEPGTGGAATSAAFDAENYPSTPEAVVDAYGTALKAKDDVAIRALLAPDVIIAEGGGAERSVDEYAGHHMPADMEFTAAVDFSLKKRDVIAKDNLATVISESQIHGTFRDQNVHSRMMETMVLRRDDDRWRIVHIHWSSAPITGEHEH